MALRSIKGRGECFPYKMSTNSHSGQPMIVRRAFMAGGAPGSRAPWCSGRRLHLGKPAWNRHSAGFPSQMSCGRSRTTRPVRKFRPRRGEPRARGIGL